MSPISYIDFDITIEQHGSDYHVEVQSLGGQARRVFRLPFSELELENILLRLGHARRSIRRIDSSEIETAKRFGAALFSAVFADDVRACLQTSLDEANRQDCGVRLRLRCNAAPALALLPWEYLYFPAANRFLTLSTKTPLVRFVELPERIRPQRIIPPLRMLTLISSPNDQIPLDVEREWRLLSAALDPLVRRGLLIVERLPQPTLPALQRRLRGSDCHILHIIGHGGFDERQQDGCLLLEDERGASYRVSGQDLGAILHDHDSLRFVMLNACDGARGAADDPFAGVAQSLVQQGIPAVVAMQFEISDEAAITIAQELYGAIADGYPVDAALSEARKRLFVSQNNVEWGTPVLYLRADDGYIFEIAPLDVLDTQSQPPAEQHSIALLPPPPPHQSRPHRPLRNWMLMLFSILALVGVVGVWAILGKPGNNQTAPGSIAGSSLVPTNSGVATMLQPTAEPASATALPQPTSAPAATVAVSAPTTAAAVQSPPTIPEPTTVSYQEWANITQPINTIDAQSSINSVAYRPDNSLFASGGRDNRIRLWDATTMTLIREILQSVDREDRVTSLAFSPDGQLLASGGAGTTIKLWNVADGSLAREFTGPGRHTGRIQSLAFAPSGQLIASGADDTTIKLWRVDDGVLLRTLTGHSQPVWGVAFSPDSSLLVSGAFTSALTGKDTQVRLWQVNDGTLQRRFDDATADIMSVAFDHSGAIIAAGSWDDTGYIWRIDDGALLGRMEGHVNGIGGIAFSPNDSVIATAAGDGNVRLFQAKDGTYICALEGHTSWSSSVAFTGDGQRLISGSDDATVRVWGLTQ